mmetsp:Transcript_45254/g.98931  ORF Transcript_45254/g.98931 Transcript_45254/m.98931 type:complete len:255 (+) Transcript_45254:364-1128(+)
MRVERGHVSITRLHVHLSASQRGHHGGVLLIHEVPTLGTSHLGEPIVTSSTVPPSTGGFLRGITSTTDNNLRCVKSTVTGTTKALPDSVEIEVLSHHIVDSLLQLLVGSNIRVVEVLTGFHREEHVLLGIGVGDNFGVCSSERKQLTFILKGVISGLRYNRDDEIANSGRKVLRILPLLLGFTSQEKTTDDGGVSPSISGLLQLLKGVLFVRNNGNLLMLIGFRLIDNFNLLPQCSCLFTKGSKEQSIGNHSHK